MANLQDFVTTGMSNGAAKATAPGPMQNTIASTPTSATDLGKDIVVAWTILFVVLAGANFAIRRFGKMA